MQQPEIPSIDDFFIRSGLNPSQDQIDCYKFAAEFFPGKSITPSSCQGYCSMTLFVGSDIVLQFRPLTYRLNLQVTRAAREIYGLFAPDTKYLATMPSSGLLVYSMGRIDGISFKDFRATELSTNSSAYRERLCRDFATFLSRGWHQGSNKNLPLGSVGVSITPRLRALSSQLPIRFRAKARNILRSLHKIEALPWVLTHGDLVPSNIMVDASSCALSGFVDWGAESEYLPFGICFYGLEEILGELKPQGFEYHPNADYLRQVFWTELCDRVLDLQKNSVLEAVKLARNLGVLLWHGIAFDNGAINRVVQEDRDIDEIRRLDAFLDVDELQFLDKGPKI
ncbi:hypothetical protein B7494_g3812 [Chlorociboria aeruginascens]|nr:hypothetical protein B7494_g3812 [Chlorociboria aeruginascens]